MTLKELYGKTVLVRDHMAGVHVGTLEDFSAENKSATLTKARKVWYWDGAASVHGIAANGLKHKTSKVAPEVARVTTLNVIEVVECSEEGAKSVREAPVWKP